MSAEDIADTIEVKGLEDYLLEGYWEDDKDWLGPNLVSSIYGYIKAHDAIVAALRDKGVDV